ncbi:hypothetical protein DICSQDRAFT_157859 [Dichomitus squalens LYAD-421 SS1]|uniref:Uncharacterized protein n=1 Tax=Dichomitus squalens (strain LYAD-421) TaxID=732165 RepID=R7SLE5_DICSQ|nr:uncharacterized protein DICSQDRAFT_157859 [Dichomitus squalens LYAD-421 SS1]EJF56555.1 hypothetical protein DICSQDRAFT_157859 [Dichomitus squalens LYAD-421 SS1]
MEGKSARLRIKQVRSKIRKADVFIFPPTVTPFRPGPWSSRRCPQTRPRVRKRTKGGRDEVYEGTLNEWMNLLSSRTRYRGSTLTYTARRRDSY